jgi:hypothetical protein
MTVMGAMPTQVIPVIGLIQMIAVLVGRAAPVHGMVRTWRGPLVQQVITISALLELIGQPVSCQ